MAPIVGINQTGLFLISETSLRSHTMLDCKKCDESHSDGADEVIPSVHPAIPSSDYPGYSDIRPESGMDSGDPSAVAERSIHAQPGNPGLRSN